ncbi:MAG: cation transporter [Verrucomicrobia bacterium]|nr:cation transporter [Verrucomicrobiota bacterium]
MVREAISSLPGVAEVKFDHDTLTATVTMKDDKCEITKKDANKALTAKGDRYKIGSFKAKK